MLLQQALRWIRQLPAPKGPQDSTTGTSMQPLTLGFADPDLEREYLKDYAYRVLNRRRWSLGIGLALYLVATLLSGALAPQQTEVMLLRLGLLAFGVTSLLASFHPIAARRMHTLCWLICFVVGLSAILLTRITPPPLTYAYIGAVVLATAALFFFFALRFVPATGLAMLLLLAFEACMGW